MMGWNGARRVRRMGRGTGLLMAVIATLLVSACGGGSAPIQAFRPTRMMVIGDELSQLLPDGRKYTVNSLSSTGAIDCTVHPLWVQTMAGAFGLTFPQCNPDNRTPSAEMYARAGAKAADAAAQVEQALAAGAFGERQIVTMYFGLNDILDLYAQFPARTADSIKAEMRERGVALGQQVNRVARAGPAVIIVTAPDLGLAPFGADQNAAFPESTNPTRSRLLSELTDAFNAGLRVSIINDGRLIGLVASDQMVRDLRPPFASFFGFTNLGDTLCPPTAPVLECTTATMAAGSSPLTWGYATATLFSPGLQGRLGQIATSRAVRNPF